MPFLPVLLLIFGVTLLAGCSSPPLQKPGIGPQLCWSDLSGWDQDQQSQLLPAVAAQCDHPGRLPQGWRGLCNAVSELSEDDEVAVRHWFEANFRPFQVLAEDGVEEGLFTGYYEPILHGSFTADARYQYPIYQRPDDMLRIELGDRFPELKGERVRGRVEGGRVVPYYSRAEIERPNSPLRGQELLWVDDPNALFFLHIQGSGRVQLEDGSMIGVGYADQNGHVYRAIGRDLVEMGALTQEEVSLQTIRHWLESNPDQAEALRHKNPSFIFFGLRFDLTDGPRGSLNVPLTPHRSVAVDRSVIPLGTPIWIETTQPSGAPDQRLWLAQDTGGAIRGAVRADLFLGHGEEAEWLAGHMKQPGRMVALLPVDNHATPAKDCE